MPKLLVVDDEPNVLYSLEKCFRSDALNVFTAPSGRQGIELVQRLRPDTLILDVRLADMSGLDVFDQVRHPRGLLHLAVDGQQLLVDQAHTQLQLM